MSTSLVAGWFCDLPSHLNKHFWINTINFSSYIPSSSHCKFIKQCQAGEIALAAGRFWTPPTHLNKHLWINTTLPLHTGFSHLPSLWLRKPPSGQLGTGSNQLGNRPGSQPVGKLVARDLLRCYLLLDLFWFACVYYKHAHLPMRFQDRRINSLFLNEIFETLFHDDGWV